MQDRPYRCFNGEPYTIWNTVVYVETRKLKAADFYFLTRLDLLQHGTNVVLVKFYFQQANGQTGAVHGHRELF